MPAASRASSIAIVVYFVTFSSALSLLAVAFQVTSHFTTAAASLVPSSISATTLGQVSLTDRSIAEVSYYFQEFLRPKGLFLFSTSQAVAEATCIALCGFMAASSPRLARRYFAFAVIITCALIVSTERGPLLAVAGGVGGVWLTRRSMLGLVGAILVVLMLGLGGGAFQGAADALSGRSLDTRAYVYTETISEWETRPWLGFGTEVDSPLGPDSPPLGSHSQYLGVLFKQGVIGLATYGLMLLVLLRAGWAAWRRQERAADWLVACLLVVLVASITEELWLDPATAVVVAVGWGALLATSSGASSRPANLAGKAGTGLVQARILLSTSARGQP
jgi:O-antigen ligase